MNRDYTKLTFEQMVEMSYATGKLVFQVDQPCFLFNGEPQQCLSINVSKKIDKKSFSIDQVFETFKEEVFEYIRENNSGDLIFVLNQDCRIISDPNSNEPVCHYKLRYANVQYYGRQKEQPSLLRQAFYSMFKGK